MIAKLLVANRGEIAVRIFRAAYELGIRSVAIHTPDDRGSVHRVKADEAYEIGERGHPVRAYLDADAIVALARRVGADVIHPGYGFLSEDPRLASACACEGITFVGPPPRVLAIAGNKLRARDAAHDAGVPVFQASELLTDPQAALDAAARLGLPLFVKAAAGGGGRGMRFVQDESELEAAVRSATSEAEGAFGDPSVFLEQALLRPRHVEVQVLADAAGNVVHLYERDCSVQRRHQKVVEVAPAPGLGCRCASGSATTRCVSRVRSATSARAPSNSSSSRRAAATSSSR